MVNSVSGPGRGFISVNLTAPETARYQYNSSRIAMYKIFTILFILLSVFVLYGKTTQVKVLMPNNTWLKADLLGSDEEGNLTLQLDGREQILRRKEFVLVKMILPPELVKAEKLFKLNKTREAGELLNSIVAKYKFPVIQTKITVLQARLKIAGEDYEGAASLLTPLLEDKMSMPELQAGFYAQGFLLLGNACEQLKRENDAVKAYRRSFELAAPEYSALANLALGRMFLKQKKTQEALDCFLENISVFTPEVPGRKPALEETIAIYRKNDNKNLKTYEDMLKKDYSKKSE